MGGGGGGPSNWGVILIPLYRPCLTLNQHFQILENKAIKLLKMEILCKIFSTTCPYDFFNWLHIVKVRFTWSCDISQQIDTFFHQLTILPNDNFLLLLIIH